MASQADRTGEAPPYRAFISYSHADAAFAHWLHRKLERHALPAAGGQAPDTLRPIFIDRAELVAGSDLTAQVRDAIGRSQALVVVCSPAAATSRWVAQEIALFRELHPERPILAALHSGEPDEAFPLPLRERDGREIEPLAADFRQIGDGKRLGLIKLVAGLAQVPLDRLIQRDAQRRQRRVIAITAFAATIILVLSALLIAAVRARAEAERRREQTEGMVEFMLTDLRQKLKGVGRLDIMSGVNERAMQHYAAETDLSRLPSDSLERRSRLLSAMGEDDLAAGNAARASVEFSEAYRITADLLHRAPQDPDRIFNHAQNEFWLGAVAQLRNDLPNTRRHYAAYRRLAGQLVAIDPANPRWQREVGYAEANLCAFSQNKIVNLAAAREHCRRARESSELVVRALPGEIDSLLDLANHFAWEADAQAKSDNIDEAIRLRGRQRETIARAKQLFPQDMRPVEFDMLAELGLALLQQQHGHPREAHAAAQRARGVARELVGRDPANKDWAGRLGQIEGIISQTASH